MALWMVQLMHVVMIMGGRTDHPCWVSVVCRMSCFLVLLWWQLRGNLSLQYVNSKNCTFKSWWGVNGGLFVGDVPRMYCMSRSNLARYLHIGR